MKLLCATLRHRFGLITCGAEAEVARVARERHGNLEAVARELRYRYFFSLVDPGQARSS